MIGTDTPISLVAAGFATTFWGDGTFGGPIRSVLFAVLDRTEERSMIRPFEWPFGVAEGRS